MLKTTLFIKTSLLFSILLACEEPSPNGLPNERIMDTQTDMEASLLPPPDMTIAQLEDLAIQQADMENIPPSLYPSPPEGYPVFRLPIAAEDLVKMEQRVVFGVDHDPSTGVRIQCEDYAGRIFPYCYDEHRGSDFILLGGFEAMDQGSAQVVAPLAGRVIDIEDGHYDRCHADALTVDVSCDGFPMQANYVTLEHDNGWITHYYHLKKYSLTVQVGDLVNCGDLLGYIGSSGYSSAPHLHFEVEDSFGRIWDPFAGPSSQPFSLWSNQSLPEAESLPSTSCSSP